MSAPKRAQLGVRLRTALRSAGSAFDEAVFALAPAVGARRLAHRRRFELAERQAERLDRLRARNAEQRSDPRGAAHFRSADQTSREAGNWMTSQLSADGILQTELKPQRDRSRLADDNDALYGGAIDKLLIRIVGQGIRPQARIRERKGLISEAAAVALNLQLEDAFRQWDPEAGVDGDDYYAHQELAARHFLVDGNGLQSFGNDKAADRYLPLVVEAINPARLETPPAREGQTTCRLGVEMDAKGKPIKYWFRRSLEADADQQFDGVDAWRVQHVYYRKQAGQTIGLPLGHRILVNCKNLLDLEEAEMVGAQTASSYVGIINTPDPYGDANAPGTVTINGKAVADIYPGKFHYAPPEEKMTLHAPNRPGSTFAPFAQHNQRLIGAGINFPYELLTGDLSQVSYLSGRLGLIALQQFVGWMQWKFIRRMCRPLWRRFVEECVITGSIDLAAKLYRDNRNWFQASGWIAPGTTWLDPVKEVTATLVAVNGNLTSKRRALAANGDDIDEIFAERAEEVRRERTLGIEPNPLPGASGKPKRPEEKPSNAGAEWASDVVAATVATEFQEALR